MFHVLLLCFFFFDYQTCISLYATFWWRLTMLCTHQHPYTSCEHRHLLHHRKNKHTSGDRTCSTSPARVPVEMLTHYTNLPMEIDFTTMENFTTVEIEIQHCGNWFYHRGKYINTVKLQEYTTFEYNIKCYSPKDKSWICLDSLEFIISTLKNRPNPII